MFLGSYREIETESERRAREETMRPTSTYSMTSSRLSLAGSSITWHTQEAGNHGEAAGWGGPVRE